MAEYPVPNADKIRVLRVPITTANTPVQLPSLEIPDDMSLSIKADPVNVAGSLVRVGGDSPSSTSADKSWPLVPNEAWAVRVKNAEEIWISGAAAPFPPGGLFCFIGAEQRKTNKGGR